MQLNEDLDEREVQVDNVLLNPNCTKEEIIGLYDAWNETYDKDMLTWGYYLDRHLDEFEDMVRINKDSKILDVAAGTGLIGQKLRERGYTNIDALDGSVGMLQKAREKGIYRNYFHSWVGPEPIEGVANDTYDAVLCVSALDVTHVNYDCFESLAAVTKPGGYVYFVGVLSWLYDKKNEFEDKMRRMQDQEIWRWILMKETQEKFDKDGPALLYAFKVLK